VRLSRQTAQHCTGEAGLLALRERRMRVTKVDFTAAREKVPTNGSGQGFRLIKRPGLAHQVGGRATGPVSLGTSAWHALHRMRVGDEILRSVTSRSRRGSAAVEGRYLQRYTPVCVARIRLDTLRHPQPWRACESARLISSCVAECSSQTGLLRPLACLAFRKPVRALLCWIGTPA
jgi:hypothetical protein